MPSKSDFIQEFKHLTNALDHRIREIEEAIKAGKLSADNEVITELNTLKQNKFRIKEFLETLISTGTERWKEIKGDLEQQIKNTHHVLDKPNE